MKPNPNNRILKNIMKTFTFVTTLVVLTQCGSGGSTNVSSNGEFDAAHGPFDKNGNYIESWADKPPSKRSKSRRVASKPKAKAKSIPKQIQKPKTQTRVARVTPRHTSPPTRTAYKPKKKVTKKYVPKKTVAKRSKPKYKPKPKPRKITPKAKPPIVHRVVKGDTLSKLSRKYGASISDIKKINKLSGSMIRLGQRLLIPRK